MNKTPTIHIAAQKDQIAETVLMPGDPLRVKFIVENYMKNAKCVTDIRNMLGYTGEYEGRQITVMGSGMGMPSMGIYSYELYNFYEVCNIIRIGTAGGIADGVVVRDVVIAMGACTTSNYASQFGLPGQYAPIADFNLLRRAVTTAEKMGVSVKVGNVLSADVFYDDIPCFELWRKMGVLAVEMEAAALYMNAARAGKNALAIMTVSNEIFTGKECTSEERQNTFTDMMKIALEL